MLGSSFVAEFEKLDPGQEVRAVLSQSFISEFAKLAGTPFLEQNRPEKTKEIYKALVRDHPEYSAEMKARIAIRKSRKTKEARKSMKDGGPAWKAPVGNGGGPHVEKVAAPGLPSYLLSAVAGKILGGLAGGALHGAGYMPEGVGLRNAEALGMGLGGLTGIGAVGALDYRARKSMKDGGPAWKAPIGDGGGPHVEKAAGFQFKAKHKNPKGGLNAAGRAAYNRATGGNLKRPQPEGGSRRDSFCARMKGMKAKLTSEKTRNDPDSRINKSLRAWNCN